MKVLYDYQAFTMQYFGGVSRCFCELISRFPEDVSYKISIKQCNNEHLMKSNLVGKLEPVTFDKIKYLQHYQFRGHGKFWDNILLRWPWFQPADKINQKYSIESLKQYNWDVFHPTFFDPYFMRYVGNRPYIITVHDMISELYADMKEQAKHKKEVVRKASAIIAVSENTKKDLCDILKIPEKKVHVIYHGGPKQETISEVPLIDNKYILYVGNRNGYKMFPKLLSEFSVFYQKHSNIKLVCTGKPFSHNEIKQIQEYKINDGVIHLRATDIELRNLYAHALAFIYPSEYEGFGMPILEAYAYGCPILLNKKSCFPEIAADAALYFNTNEDSSISNALETIDSYSTDQRNRLVEKGYNRLANFSWEKSANQLINIYKSVI